MKKGKGWEKLHRKFFLRVFLTGSLRLHTNSQQGSALDY